MRILVADDQARVRLALRVLLDRRPDLEIAGEVEDAAALTDALETLDPDVILFSWELPGLSQTDAVAVIRRARPKLLLIALSGRPEACRAAIEAGVDAFVSKAESPDRLLAALDACRLRLAEAAGRAHQPSR